MGVPLGTVLVPMVGRRFGRLWVQSPTTGLRAGQPRQWSCICDCGNRTTVRGTALRGGTTQSCGCLNYEKNQSTLNARWTLGRGKLSSKVQELNPKRLTFSDFCKQYGLSTKVVRSRLKKGWAVERALETPVDDSIVKRNRRSRAKGRKLQQYVVACLKQAFPALDDVDIQEVPSSCSGVDVRLSIRARAVLPVSIECKNTVDYPGEDALEQAATNAYPGTAPAVIWHPPNRKYSESMIIMRLDAFLGLVDSLLKKGESRTV